MYLKKSLGQNFLKSPKIIGDMVSSAKIKEGDFVLEIGPGEGALTEALLSAKTKVTAIEKDRRLISVLSEKFSSQISTKQLTLIYGDVLDINIDKFAKGDYKVAANIPYYITGQIFRKFLETEKRPVSVTVLIQKEVAERIVAKDGKESILSISIKIYGNPKYVKTVGRGNFRPAPNVDSAILNIENISGKNFPDRNFEKKFFEILRAGFAHKRKLLSANLSPMFAKSQITEALAFCDISPKARAENLSASDWLKLAEKLLSI
jgi:16S rRNA (adenine1518-N6/adenine1519-N6)-dimethyltransferase